jgi:hypothetical protein
LQVAFAGVGNTEIEVDIKEIKGLLEALNKKMNLLLERRETLSMMVLAEKSLKSFLEEEPDLYSIKDLKVRYSEGQDNTRSLSFHRFDCNKAEASTRSA